MESRNDQGVDSILELRAPDRAKAQILVETKRVVESRDATVLSRLFERCRSEDPQTSTAFIVAAPFVSPRARELLSAEDVGWFDATGNLRMHVGRPSFFVDRVGASRDPYGADKDRRLRSLRGAGTARVIRTLLDEDGPFGVRELAVRAEVGAATASRVLDLLNREVLIERDHAGAVVDVRKGSLLRRWAQDYHLTATNNAVPVLAPRGVDRTVNDLTEYGRSYAVTATAALRAYLPEGHAAITPLSLLTVFVDDAVAAQRILRLRQVDRGANVLLVEPFDPIVYRHGRTHDRVSYVSPSQAVIDLMTGPGRSPQEAEQLLQILAAEDERWTG